MGIRFGPIDPLQLIFEIVNSLIEKKVISSKEADELIKNSLEPSLSEEEKEKILISLKGNSPKEKEKNDK